VRDTARVLLVTHDVEEACCGRRVVLLREGTSDLKSMYQWRDPRDRRRVRVASSATSQ